MMVLDWEKLYVAMLVFEDIRLVHGSTVDGCGLMRKMETVKPSTSAL
jgi:hypothetical protein